ncbi:MAG: DUF6049 family protein [Acidimicrobiales bacterium]
MTTLRNLWVLAILVSILTVGTGPVSAQEQERAEERPAPLRLVSQSPFVAADGQLEIRFALDDFAAIAAAMTRAENAEDGAEPDDGQGPPTIDVVVTVYAGVLDPADLGGDPDVAINRLPNVALSSLPVDGDGIVTVRLPIRSGDQFDDIDRMLIPDRGVYPVIVELRAGDETLGSLQTEMIRLPVEEADADVGTARAGPPVAVMLPVGEDGVSVEVATDLLATHADLPIASIVHTEALDRLRSDAELTSSFVAALGGRSVVVAIDPDLDVSSLASIGRLDRYRRAVAAAREAGAALDLPVDEATVPVGGAQTEAGAAELTALGIERIVDARSLSGPQPATSYRMPTGNGPLFNLEASPVSTDLIAEGRSPAARTQRVLANLALVDPETPVILNAAPDSAGDHRETLDVLFFSLARPELTMMPLADLAPLAASEIVEAAPQPAQDLSEILDHTATSVALLSNYRAFYVGGPASPASFDAELDSALALSADPATQLDRVVALNRRVEAELATISLPENQSVTLAARSAPIPLTIENSASGQRQVLLQFRSDKVEVEQDGQLVVVPPGTSSIDISVEARSLGVSPLQVSLLTPDGQRVLSTTRFDVRSTAIPGLGLLISAVGLLVLGAWWYMSIRRKRSPPADRTDNDGPPGGSGPDTSDRTDVLASGTV